MAHGWIDNRRELEALIDFSREHKVEQLTVRPVNRPESSRDDEAGLWTSEHHLRPSELQDIRSFLESHGTLLMTLIHGASIYDVKGQNVCLTDSLTITAKTDDLPSSSSFPMDICGTTGNIRGQSSYDLNGLKAITTVYSYYMPEIRELITSLTRDYPHEVFLRSVSPGLDDFHQPIIAKLVASHRHDVPHLGEFAHRYPTSGSEEGIREYLTLLQAAGEKSIYVWKGEYEGYREIARTRNLGVVELDADTDPATLPRGHWLLSNPSARDGMIVPPERIRAICDAGHQVFYDLAYLGMTDPAVYDLSHPNIAAAVISYSKPFGLFYYRIGFTFSRAGIPVLEANKWFKNIYGLLIADRVLDTIDLPQLTRKYKRLQAEIVAAINAELGLALAPSDAFLLARLPAGDARALPADQAQIAARDFDAAITTGCA